MSHLHKIDYELYYTSFFKNFWLHFTNIFNYKGNEGRKAFWLFILAKYIFLFIPFIYLVVQFAVAVIDTHELSISREFMNSTDTIGIDNLLTGSFLLVLALYLILSFILLLATLSAEARRLADAGFSRAWLFLYIVPFIGGGLVLFIFELLETRSHYNNYVLKYNKEGVLEQAQLFQEADAELKQGEANKERSGTAESTPATEGQEDSKSASTASSVSPESSDSPDKSADSESSTKD